MRKREEPREIWETPSLEWIHQIRRGRQRQRAGQPLYPLSRKESERLAKKFGLKLARPTAVGR